MSIAENIKDARIKAGFSQQQLADGLGVTRQLISKWETGISMTLCSFNGVIITSFIMD